MMLAEFLLIPGVGVAGILSFISLGGAVWYSFEYISTAAGWWTFGVVVALLVAVIILALRTKLWKRLGLKTEINSTVGDKVIKVKVGDKGIAKTRLAPIGMGEFNMHSIEVKSYDNSMIDAGVGIEVVSIEDNKIIVKTI